MTEAQPETTAQTPPPLEATGADRMKRAFPFGRGAAAVYLTAAFCLIGLHFLTQPKVWPGACRLLTGLFFEEPWLGKLAYWALASVFFYVVPPTVVAALILKRGPHRFGLGLGRLHRHLGVYTLLLLGVLPLVALSSLRADFLWTYPFDRKIGLALPYFLAWEALYVLQFFGLEYFFRGFLLFPLEKEIGKNAVLVMIVPYAMIHFQKPFLEANAAVFAGLILGWMALKTRSIWGGVVVHGTVAVTMDSLALARLGMWPPGG
ncbi:MAG: CPBP family intramembrane glutamic endopeptidase [Planctomycetota bacterium]